MEGSVSRFTFHVSRFTFHVSRFTPDTSPASLLFMLSPPFPLAASTRMSERFGGIAFAHYFVTQAGNLLHGISSFLSRHSRWKVTDQKWSLFS